MNTESVIGIQSTNDDFKPTAQLMVTYSGSQQLARQGSHFHRPKGAVEVAKLLLIIRKVPAYKFSLETGYSE
jgi:hypothetical protein